MSSLPRQNGYHQENRRGLSYNPNVPVSSSVLQQTSCCGLLFLSEPISSRSSLSSPTLFLHRPIPLSQLPVSVVTVWKLVAMLIRELGRVSTLCFQSSSSSYLAFSQLCSRPPDMIPISTKILKEYSVNPHFLFAPIPRGLQRP